MVNGIELFREHFSDYKDQYTIIGGFACDLLMTDAGLNFRKTVDIDMVIIVEALTTEFAEAFWRFISKGGYRARQRSSGQPEFYRFVDPTDPSYPKMIEIFSRPQNHVTLQPDTHLMPLHIDDEVSSLSAILLNDDYCTSVRLSGYPRVCRADEENRYTSVRYWYLTLQGFYS